MSIGMRLKKARGSLTQHEFANLLSVHFNTLARYERNERTPDIDFLKKVADCTNTNILWLSTGEGSMMKSALVQFTPPVLIITIEALEDYEKELGRSLTSKEKATIISGVLDLMGERYEDAPHIRAAISKIIHNIHSTLSTVDQLLENDNSIKVAAEQINDVLAKVLSKEEANKEMTDFLYARRIKRNEQKFPK